MTHCEKPRLFRKTIRANDACAAPSTHSKPSPSHALRSSESAGCLASFVFGPKVKRKGKKDTDAGHGHPKTVFRLRAAALDRKVAGKLRAGLTPIRDVPSASFTVDPSASHSCLGSRSVSPHPISSLTIEAINLELELTALLCQAETLPTPQRSMESFQAYLRVLGLVGERDPVYGEAIQKVLEEVNSMLVAAKAKEARELMEQNKSLKKYLGEQKDALRREAQERTVQERVTETLLKEKHLLGKKVEQLQWQCKKAVRSEEGEESARKIEELEEGLRAARKREGRLLRLLEVVKKGVNRDEVDSVPPLDLLLLRQLGPSRAPSVSQFPSATSTEGVESSF